MAIKISGTTVIDNSRNIDNVGNFCATTLYGDGSNITGLPVPALVQTPTNTSPSDAATCIDNCPTLCASSYASAYGISMCCSQWQVDDNSDFSSPVFNLCCSGTSTQVTLGDICANCTYYWRVRYFDNNGCCSDYSTATCFTTCTVFVPSAIGQSFGGGYYTGTICAAGTCYYLIVAPNSTGCGYCQWKTALNTSNMAGDTLNDGYNNTYTYIDNSCHPAGNFAATRTIGGFCDWYLPAINEVERMWNYASSMPAGERYTTSRYWSSTEGYSSTACAWNFGPGYCLLNSKNDPYASRAIRRIAFP